MYYAVKRDDATCFMKDAQSWTRNPALALVSNTSAPFAGRKDLILVWAGGNHRRRATLFVWDFVRNTWELTTANQTN